MKLVCRGVSSIGDKPHSVRWPALGYLSEHRKRREGLDGDDDDASLFGQRLGQLLLTCSGAGFTFEYCLNTALGMLELEMVSCNCLSTRCGSVSR